jgi:formate/nitrite transporter
MSFTQVGLAAPAKTPPRLDGHGGIVPGRAHWRIDDPGQASLHVSRVETRPEQAKLSDRYTTSLAPPAKPAAVGDLTPSETAQRLIEWSTAKSTLSGDRLIVLGLLAGVFIALGGAFFTAVMAELSLTHGPSRLLGGIAFSTGLLLVCMSGAELSTGNCMTVAPWASGRLTTLQISRNLLVSYAANAAGALALVLLVAGSGLLQTGHGRVAAAIAEAKMNLSFEQAFFRGVLCNALVCIAVWLILAGRTIPSKLAGLIFPISAFITLGFEHSIANFYLIPAGLMAGAAGSVGAAALNLFAVTLGNLVGGIMVALAVWFAYLRDGTTANRTRLASPMSASSHSAR